MDIDKKIEKEKLLFSNEFNKITTKEINAEKDLLLLSSLFDYSKFKCHKSFSPTYNNLKTIGLKLVSEKKDYKTINVFIKESIFKNLFDKNIEETKSNDTKDINNEIKDLSDAEKKMYLRMQKKSNNLKKFKKEKINRLSYFYDNKNDIVYIDAFYEKIQELTIIDFKKITMKTSLISKKGEVLYSLEKDNDFFKYNIIKSKQNFKMLIDTTFDENFNINFEKNNIDIHFEINNNKYLRKIDVSNQYIKETNSTLYKKVDSNLIFPNLILLSKGFCFSGFYAKNTDLLMDFYFSFIDFNKKEYDLEIKELNNLLSSNNNDNLQDRNESTNILEVNKFFNVFDMTNIVGLNKISDLDIARFFYNKKEPYGFNKNDIIKLLKENSVLIRKEMTGSLDIYRNKDQNILNYNPFFAKENFDFKNYFIKENNHNNLLNYKSKYLEDITFTSSSEKENLNVFYYLEKVDILYASDIELETDNLYKIYISNNKNFIDSYSNILLKTEQKQKLENFFNDEELGFYLIDQRHISLGLVKEKLNEMNCIELFEKKEYDIQKEDVQYKETKEDDGSIVFTLYLKSLIEKNPSLTEKEQDLICLSNKTFIDFYKSFLDSYLDKGYKIETNNRSIILMEKKDE